MDVVIVIATEPRGRYQFYPIWNHFPICLFTMTKTKSGAPLRVNRSEGGEHEGTPRIEGENVGGAQGTVYN